MIGDQGICPECEEEKDWHDIDSNFAICHVCVQALINDEKHERELEREVEVAHDYP